MHANALGSACRVLSFALLCQCSSGPSPNDPDSGAGRAGGSGSSAGGRAGSGGSDAGDGGAHVAGSANGGSSAAGTGGSTEAGSGGMPFDPEFMLGADISSVQEAVDAGAIYVDTDGVQKSLLEILANHGFNTIRLRTFVDPSAAYGYANPMDGEAFRRSEPYCDEQHTIEVAQEIKRAGMGFVLDFHYSDNWADPGKQIIPTAWRDATTITDLASRVRGYTRGVVANLVSAGARPDIVQIGNEITPGMLIHVPTANPSPDQWGNIQTQLAPVNGSVTNWTNLATLLREGIAGVKEVDPTIQIMLHVENTESFPAIVNWVRNARMRGVQFDLLGLSCYTAFQGEPAIWEDTFEQLATNLTDVSFVIAEYNPERRRANQIMRDLPDGRGRGTFLWEPTQGGSWGDALFTFVNDAHRANDDDFAEFDAIKAELGL